MSLQPGPNVLRFCAAPVKAGLYVVRGVAARLGSLRLALPLLPPERRAGATSFSGSGGFVLVSCSHLFGHLAHGCLQTSGTECK